MCRQILYQLSHKGSPRILEWIAYPPPGDLPDPGIEPGSPALQEDSLPTELSGKPFRCVIHYYELIILHMISTSYPLTTLHPFITIRPHPHTHTHTHIHTHTLGIYQSVLCFYKFKIFFISHKN